MAGLSAGGSDPLTAGILRAGDALDARHSLLHTAADDLISSDHDINRGRAVAHGGNAVAVSVDLYHEAILSEGIGRTEIDRRVHGFMEQGAAFGRLNLPVPEHFMAVFAQLCVQVHLLHGHAAADCDGCPFGRIG